MSSASEASSNPTWTLSRRPPLPITRVAVGETRTQRVEPADGYGESDPTAIIDFPLGVPITLNAGTGYVTKKVGDILLGQLHQPRFSDCTSVEFISLAVRDPNGDVFAVPGVRY